MHSIKSFSAITSLAAVVAVTLATASRPAPAPAPATAAAAHVAVAAPTMTAMLAAAAAAGSGPAGAAAAQSGQGFFFTVIGGDANGATNPFAQPQNQALSGGGRDQTQQFTDLLVGSIHEPSVVVGRLGDDIMLGGTNVDFIIGGPEHFNPLNRDKAFLGAGDDVFMWAPGDGSDRVDGGPGLDTVMFGLIAENDGSGNPAFGVSTDQQAGDVFFDFFGFPLIDVSNSPGFCRVIDASTSADAAAQLAALDVERLVQFIIRSVNQDFVNGVQNTDNGLRVTLHLRSVEFLVCTSEAGGATEAFDLRTTPPTPIPTSALPLPAQFVLQ